MELPDDLSELKKLRETAKAQRDAIARSHPTLTFRPNTVQRRVLKMLDEGLKAGVRDFGVLPGNRVGKTALLANVVWNIAHGVQSPDFEYDFIRNWPFRKELRLICSRADMLPPDGGMWQAIHQWWPAGLFRSSMQGYDHEAYFELPNGYSLSVRRPDQPLHVHESSTLGAVFINEPPDTPMLWQQYGIRLSGNGLRSLWGTVWNSDMAWVGEEIVENDKARHCYGDIEECCAEHYPGGHMTHRQIEQLVESMPQDQREARTTGRFGQLSSKVFSVTPEVHFCDESLIPEGLQCFASLDPHPHKPWVYLVGGLDERGDWWIVQEFPTEFPYHKIRGDYRGLSEYAEIIRDMDGSWGVKDRVIDRRGSGYPTRKDYGTSTVRLDLEREHKLRFRDGNQHVQDDGNEIGGITVVKNLLRHDPDKGIISKIHISRRCRNLCYQLQHLGKKKDRDTGRPTEKIDDEFLDFPRALMYLVMSQFGYRRGMTPETVKRNRLSAHEKEIYKRLKERGLPAPEPHEATSVSWFN